jgi:hypothetical protein
MLEEGQFSSEDLTASSLLAASKSMRPHRRVIAVTIPVFSGYAALVTLQAKLRARVGIPDDPAAPGSEFFTAAVSCQYIGNLIFRMAHNVLFGWLRPRSRVFAAVGCMAAAVLTVACLFRASDPWLGWVPIAYLLGGAGVGTFESNLLHSIGGLGDATKLWAIIGMPVGFNLVTIVGFSAMSAGVSPEAVYWAVAAGLVGSAWVFFGIPEAIKETQEGGIRAAWATRASWLGTVAPNAVALMLNMFTFSLATALALYVFNERKTAETPFPEVPLLDPYSANAWSVRHDAFLAVQNVFVFLGDFLGRPAAYRLNLPVSAYLVLQWAGVAIFATRRGLFTPIGMFCITFANGAIYAASTKKIDLRVPRASQLMALSCWLFVGDLGSVLGSNTVGTFRELLCPSPLPHICKKYD